MRNRLMDRRGFTLTEVMVTLLLSVFLATALLWASMANRHSTRTAVLYSKAMAVARSYAEQIKAEDYDALADWTDQDVLISDNATAASDDDLSGTVTVDVTDNGNETKTVVVTVDWTHRTLAAASGRQVSLTTLVSSF